MRAVSAVLLLFLLGPAQVGAAAQAAPRELAAPATGGPAERTTLVRSGAGLVLAWTERTPQATQVRAALLGRGEGTAGTGATWRALGGVINGDARFNAAQLRSREGPGGQVWLGWAEDSGEAHVDSWLMSAWTGAAWSDPARYAVRRNLSDAGRSRAFDVLPGNVPTLAWTDVSAPGAVGDVVRPLNWQAQGGQDGTWVAGPVLSDPRAAAFAPDLRVRAGGLRTVTYLQGDFATMGVMTQRETSPGRWTPLGAAVNRAPNTFAADPQLALDAGGNPVVAWIEADPRPEGGPDRLFVSRWTGRAWQPLGGALPPAPQSAEAPALALTPGGEVRAAWLAGGQVRAARWTGKAWQSYALPDTRQATSPSLSPDGAYLAVSDGGRLRVWALPQER